MVTKWKLVLLGFAGSALFGFSGAGWIQDRSLQLSNAGNMGPLQMDHSRLQVVSGSQIDDTRVYHVRNIEENNFITWKSTPTGATTFGTSIGDVDNDGKKEIVTIVNKPDLKDESGNVVEARNQRILVYKDGSMGNPTFASADIGYNTNGVRDSVVADADDDGKNELVLARNNRVEIYRWSGKDFVKLWASLDYSNFVWNVSVGDADNDGRKEVVLAMFSKGTAIVYKHTGRDTWGDPVTTASIGPFNINRAKIRDADNDGRNEIIGGSNCNKLNIWKYADGKYDTVFLSEDLGGFTLGVDSGDIDGDGQNEVAVAASKSREEQDQPFEGKIFIFKFNKDRREYRVIDTIPIDYMTSHLWIGNLDQSKGDEIVTAGGSKVGFRLRIYKYAPEKRKVFEALTGPYIKIG